MPVPAVRRLFSRRTHAFLAVAVAAVSGAAVPARAAVITAMDMARGFTATREQCAALADAVWVGVGRYRFCIRYYVSTAGGAGPVPAVFLQGDRRSGRFDRRSGRFVADPGAKPVDTVGLQRFADLLSRRTRTTAIYLARLGVDGSSGHHDMRRTVLEGRALDQALTLIKRRHGFQGFHLLGQSGGAANVGHLLALRDDVGCAVPGAGPLALARGGASRTVMDPLLLKYDGVSGIAAIVRNRPGRILVVGDPLDRTVPIESQRGFVRALLQAGVPAEQYLVAATDDRHHGVTSFAALALSGCIEGKSRDAIAGDLARLGERMAAARAVAASGRGPAPAGTGLRPGPAAAYPRGAPRPAP